MADTACRAAVLDSGQFWLCPFPRRHWQCPETFWDTAGGGWCCGPPVGTDQDAAKDPTMHRTPPRPHCPPHTTQRIVLATESNEPRLTKPVLAATVLHSVNSLEAHVSGGGHVIMGDAQRLEGITRHS